MTPTMSAKAKSLSVWPPRIRRQMIGSSVMNVVASERLTVSHSETFAMVANGDRLRSALPVLGAVVAGVARGLDHGVWLALARHERLNVLLRVRLARLELELHAALEVDPEIEALGAQRDQAGDDHGARDREPQLALPHVVDLQPLRRLLALRAHEARAVEPLEAAEQAEHRARGDHRREQRDHGAD